MAYVKPSILSSSPTGAASISGISCIITQLLQELADECDINPRRVPDIIFTVLEGQRAFNQWAVHNWAYGTGIGSLQGRVADFPELSKHIRDLLITLTGHVRLELHRVRENRHHANAAWFRQPASPVRFAALNPKDNPLQSQTVKHHKVSAHNARGQDTRLHRVSHVGGKTSTPFYARANTLRILPTPAQNNPSQSTSHRPSRKVPKTHISNARTPSPHRGMAAFMDSHHILCRATESNANSGKKDARLGRPGDQFAWRSEHWVFQGEDPFEPEPWLLSEERRFQPDITFPNCEVTQRPSRFFRDGTPLL